MLERRKERKRRKEPATAQRTIPVQKIFPDGTVRVRNGYYTRSICFKDMNYQLAQEEDQEEILKEWKSFLNFFDVSVKFQFTFINRLAEQIKEEDNIRLKKKGDPFDSVRAEYGRMLQDQIRQGNNGLRKEKYLTFGIESEDYSHARPMLQRIEDDLLSNFRKIGVEADALNGIQRMEVLYDIFHISEHQRRKMKLRLSGTELTVRDQIAPPSFSFQPADCFIMGKTYCSIGGIYFTASHLNDEFLKDILSIEKGFVASLHIEPLDQQEAVKMVKHVITELDSSKIEEQKKAFRSGYDMDILPSDLNLYAHDAGQLLKSLQSNNERLFRVTFLTMNTGHDEEELRINMGHTRSSVQKHNCTHLPLSYEQENGMVSCLPLAENRISQKRELTGKAVAILIPFITQELFQKSREALYYGVNSISQNLIMADRKTLKNPNGLILGTPGSGKSFSAKREITNVFLATDDDIIICDPEAEYESLVKRLHGEVVKINAASTQYINPMDIHMDYSDDEDPLYLKSDFILSLCELVMNSRSGIEPIERSVIDRCLRKVYSKYLENPVSENIPVLGDLYDALMEQEEQQAKRVADSLEIYVKGSLNVFNHRTNVDIRNRLVCYDIRDLGKQLKKIGMLIVQDQVWGRVTANRSSGKSTRFYIDEFHLLLRETQTSAYCVEIWKRFRKWGGIPTGITQNVKDLLSSREIENIFENSDFIYMLNQASGDRKILAEQLNISEHQLSFVTQSGEGEGLLFFGNVILPFTDHFPKNTELYRIMTTKLSEVRKR